MLSSLSMKNKLLCTILPLILLIYLATVLLVYHSSKASTEALAEIAVEAIAKQQISDIGGYFNAPLYALRNTAVLLGHEIIEGELPDRRIADQMLESLLAERPEVAALWWIPGVAADGQSVLWLRDGEKISPALELQREALVKALGQRRARVEEVIPLLPLGGAGGRLVIAVLVPVIANEQVVGHLGIGLDAGQLQRRVAQLRPLGVGVAALIAQDTTLVAHPDPSRIGKRQSETEGDFLGDHLGVVIDAVRRGEGMTLRFASPAIGGEAFMLIAPLRIGATTTPWSLGLAFPSSALLGGVKTLAIQLLLIGGFSVLVLAVAMLLLGRAIAKPLQTVAAAVRELATGEADLTSRLPSHGRDELGSLGREFNHFLGTMATLVFEIKGTSQSLQNTSVELQEQSRASGRTVDAQRDEVGQLAAAMQQMAVTVDEVAGNAGRAAQVTGEGDAAVARGQQRVSSLVQAINQDVQTLENVSSLAAQLDEASQAIGTIVAVISDIADQTNLLALNAAIESARAGEQGRGFAVVADEVRALARRTHSSTEEVHASVTLIQERTRTVVDIIEQSRRTAQSNAARAEEANQALTSLSQIIGEVRDRSQQIALATEQQATTSDLLSRSLTSIAESAEEASQSSRQVSQRSDDLEASAARLNGLVSRFKL
ncbi:Methyl-accepting chemotaxis protein (MCP) signaling domain protein [compost metagenome]